MFDTIMGVGRSPQITKDYISNNFSTLETDIAPMCRIVYGGAPSAAYTVTGTISNIIDESFDANNISIQYSVTTLGASTEYAANVIDLGREFFIKQVTFRVIIDDATASSQSARIYSGLTYDGSTNTGFTLRTTETGTTGANNDLKLTANYFKARFLWVDMTNQCSGVTNLKFKLYKLRIVIEPMQTII